MTDTDRPDIHKYVHPPLVALGYIAVAYALKWLIPLPFTPPLIVRNAGFGMVVAGFLFGVGAYLEFRKARTTLDPHGSVRALVTGGIYQFTRNPIYLGFLFMVVGLPLNAGTYWGIVLAPFFALTLTKLVIEKEEAHLLQKFPQAYGGYKSRVRRWL